MTEEKCPELVLRARGYCCRVTERPSGRIQNCPKEYGGECYEEEKEEVNGKRK